MTMQLRKRFDALPISGKLMAMMVMVTLGSLILGFMAVTLDRVDDSLEAEIAKVSYAARITADSSIGPLSFSDPVLARERLAYLKTIPGILGAQLVSENGEIFAQWWRGKAQPDSQRVLRPAQLSLLRPAYVVGVPVHRGQRVLGTLLLEASTEDVWRELMDYLRTLALVMTMVLVVSMILAYGLQSSISGPIMRLAAVTRNISRHKDYSRRVHRDADDEIGQLIRGFNVMLERIGDQERERECIHAQLRRAYDELELRVEERTWELQALNAALEAEITERRAAEARITRALEEKEVLLREVHHRVKNNLQVVYGLLSLQSRGESDPRIARLLEDSRQRVKTMAIVHETLYDSRDLSGVSVPAFVRSLVDNISSVFRLGEAGIRIETRADDIELDLDRAVPVGLVINELVTNSVKYAFPGDQGGLVRVDLRKIAEDGLELCVCDDGVGLPPGVDAGASKTLGLKLVQALSAQLQGNLRVDPPPGVGFHLKFPME